MSIFSFNLPLYPYIPKMTLTHKGQMILNWAALYKLYHLYSTLNFKVLHMHMQSTAMTGATIAQEANRRLFRLHLEKS